MVAICGFDKAVDRVRSASARLALPLVVHVEDELTDADRAFAETSELFDDPADRERAQTIAADRGAAIAPKWPLGYDDTRALVCFEARCPNNTLPILWKEAPSWEPLFPRL
jgi:uncharacterized protein